MTLWKLAGSTAAAALFAGQAFAVTPEEVWEQWQESATSYGQTLSAASEAREGDVLVLTDVTMAGTQDAAAAQVAIPEVRFADQGDGTVQVTMSETYQVNMQTEAVDTRPAQAIVLDVAHPGLAITASGEVGALNYAFQAPTISVTLNSIDGAPAAEAGAGVKVDVTNMAGTYAVTGTDSRTIASDATAASVAIDVTSTDAAAGTSGAFRASMANLASTSNTTMGTATDLTDMNAALKAGFSTVADFTYGATDFGFDATDAQGKTTGTGTLADGGFKIAMDAAKLNYGVTNNGLSVTLSGPTIPIPEFTMAFAQSGADFTMPVSKSDTPSDFAVVSRVVDLTMADAAWALFDPQAQLPRDPITLIIDLAGKATLSTDLMDEAAMAALGDAAPGQIDALDIRQVQLRAIGAEVNATGALTFDNTGGTTFNGMPAPTGTVNIDATGINGVLDKLTAMGLLPEDQVAGARMMLGMFAKPGEGADTLTSVLEFRDGGFFANGMQLQ